MTDLAELLVPTMRSGLVHPAIDHALSAFAPADAQLAADAIRSALGGRLACGAPEPWGGSRLTGDGFPFELSFSTAEPRLRFTLEPGARELTPRQRLDIAAAVVARVGGVAVAPSVLAGLRTMQAEGALAYGAWVGCRVAAGSVACKLYVEVPRGAPFRAESLVLQEREAVPRMLAYAPATGAFEIYCRVPSFEPSHLAAVLELVDGESLAPWLLNFIEEAYGHRVRGRLPGPSVGVSYLRHSAERRVTLHFFARALWGSDAGIRRAFARLAHASGWDEEAYLRVTAPLAKFDAWRTFHGLFGITMDAAHRMSFNLGVRPVAP